LIIGAVILFSLVVEAGRTTIFSIIIKLRFGNAGRAISFSVFIELSIFRVDMNILKIFVRERKRCCVNKILGK
jgi:hypothetical protein